MFAHVGIDTYSLSLPERFYSGLPDKLAEENQVFDQSFLPEADFQFVLLPDTHYMLDSETVEFESRRQQTGRIAYALALIEALNPDFVVHLGDVVQEFPESDAFETAATEATRQLDALDVETRYVAGNHDVGDKPDPTMPTRPVTQASLEAYHERYGRSWYSWDYGGVHFVVLNSQLLNSSLRAARDQRNWLEGDLQATSDEPIFLFLHLPLFLHQPDEPATGHYDNIGLPAREWLLALLRDHAVDRVFAAHTHFSFRNYVGGTQLQIVPSPSFTRPGFGQLFSSCPPPERGRDDRGKLGFYLVRIVDDDAQIHHIRTRGVTGVPSSPVVNRFLTRSTSGVEHSPVGVSLLHPLTEAVRVPATFPSVIEQKVHNDYPLLGCLEMGIATVRTPVWSHDDDLLQRKAKALAADGATVVGTVLAGDGQELSIEEIAIGGLDEIEIRIVGSQPLSPEVCRAIEAVRRVPLSVSLSTVVPGRTVEGKQHARLRSAFSAADIERLDDRLSEEELHVDRVLQWVGDDDDPWERIGSGPSPDSLSHIEAADWLVPTVGADVRQAIGRIGRALFAVAPLANSRLYIEPLQEMDRTMDSAPGLLDRRCNPTPAFHAVRCLNTVLFGKNRRWRRRFRQTGDGVEFFGLESTGLRAWLALPLVGESQSTVDHPGETDDVGRRWTVSLADATSRSTEAATTTVEVDGPTLIVETIDPPRS